METYPLKAAGEYAGEFCSLKNCRNQAKFALAVFGMNGKRILCCGHHLSVACRGIHILEGRSVVVQEIPGYKTASETVLWDGKLLSVPTAERKRIE